MAVKNLSIRVRIDLYGSYLIDYERIVLARPHSGKDYGENKDGDNGQWSQNFDTENPERFDLERAITMRNFLQGLRYTPDVGHKNSYK